MQNGGFLTERDQANEPATLNPSAARALVDQIATGLEVVWSLVAKAYEGRAWTALGYYSWDDMCTREFGSSRIRLPREERQEVVSSLRESGLSLRAIASATGLSYGSVQSQVIKFDQSPTVDNSGSAQASCDEILDPTYGDPTPATITGLDGRAYPAHVPGAPFLGGNTITDNTPEIPTEGSWAIIGGKAFPADANLLPTVPAPTPPAPVPHVLTATEIGQRIDLAARRIESFLTGYRQFRDLADNPDRPLIIARLTTRDQELLAQAESDITWTN